MKNRAMKLKSRTSIRINNFGLIGVLLFLMSFGFALITATLKINGSVAVATGIWDIYLNNVAVKDGSVDAINPIVVNASDRTIASFKVQLSNPNDFYEFEADMVNDGNYDAMISEVKLEMSGLPENLKKYFTYTVTYSNGDSLQVKDLLPSKNSSRIKVRVAFNNDENLVDVFNPNSAVFGTTFDLNLEVVFGLANDEAVDNKTQTVMQN